MTNLVHIDDCKWCLAALAFDFIIIIILGSQQLRYGGFTACDSTGDANRLQSTSKLGTGGQTHRPDDEGEHGRQSIGAQLGHCGAGMAACTGTTAKRRGTYRRINGTHSRPQIQPSHGDGTGGGADGRAPCLLGGGSGRGGYGAQRQPLRVGAEDDASGDG